MEAGSPALPKSQKIPGEADGLEAAEARWSHGHCLWPQTSLFFEHEGQVFSAPYYGVEDAEGIGALGRTSFSP